MEIIVSVIVIWLIICLLRAKFDKKFIFSTKLFYILLFGGVVLIGTILGMIIGFISMSGSVSNGNLIFVQNEITMSWFVIVIYALVLSLIFNLNTLKNNIVKIIMTLLAIAFGGFCISIGITLGCAL